MAAETELNATLPTFWELLAEKLARQPELLAVARRNCARWLGEGHSAPQRLRAWDELLAAAEQNEAGRRRLREVLAGANEADERLREFHPFARNFDPRRTAAGAGIMRLPALKHLLGAVQSLSPAPNGFACWGPARLLASFPELGEAGGPLELSFDADLLVEWQDLSDYEHRDTTLIR